MLTLERIDTSVTELWEEMVGGGGGRMAEGRKANRFQISDSFIVFHYFQKYNFNSV